ncbi:MAG: hypothetical protein K6G76_02615 [Lachnospiraceae bacterium]|nr:hypothetical protein [Lachnospiraceae bacterium]
MEPEGYDWTIRIMNAESSGKPCIKYMSGAPSAGSYEIKLYEFKDDA